MTEHNPAQLQENHNEHHDIILVKSLVKIKSKIN